MLSRKIQSVRTKRCPRRQSSFTLSDMRTDLEAPIHRRAPRPSSAPPSFLLAQRLTSRRPQSAAAAVLESRFHRLAQPSVEVPRSNSPASKLMETRTSHATAPIATGNRAAVSSFANRRGVLWEQTGTIGHKLGALIVSTAIVVPQTLAYLIVITVGQFIGTTMVTKWLRTT